MAKGAWTTALSLTLVATLITINSISTPAAQKSARQGAPEIAARLRQSHTTSKAPKAEMSRPQRINAKATPNRAAAFANRTLKAAAIMPPKVDPTARVAAHHPHLPMAKTATAAGTFYGRLGTGLGDIEEDESNDDPNDDDAQLLEDLPANVIGTVDDDDDFDFFGVLALDGEVVRVEIVADRVFGSPLDSYAFVLDEDGDLLAENDDGFDGSFDSFLRFEAPYTGLFFIGVTDIQSNGDDDYDYVLNLSVGEDDIGEVEPNDSGAMADFLPNPGMAFGEVDGEDDYDIFTFEAVAGQAMIFDVDADIFLSEADIVVEFFDANGRFLFGNDDEDGLDPRFNIVLPYTGDYYAMVYSRNDVDGEDGYYSLSISTQSASLAPHISSLRFSYGKLKKVMGSGFIASGDGAVVEVNTVEVPSYNYAGRTNQMRLSPTRTVYRNDVVTVLNPDGRRSNPVVIN